MSLLGRIAALFRGGRSGGRTVHAVHDRPIRASYDLARTNDDNRRHWAVADSYDADSANSIAVRRTTVKRSRYETANNGFLQGINRTLANYEVGRGPKLRMQTANPGMNATVLAAWNRWTKRVKLARKLRTAVKARAKDGEAFLLAKTNLSLPDDVKLDLIGLECEQITSTDLLFAQKNRIDGITFDEFGNPISYDVLPYHPGGSWTLGNQRAEQVPAKFMFHLFQEERPGQHRAIPESASTLPVSVQSRRWREATLQAAENLADFSIFIKTGANPMEGPDQLAPFSSFEIEKGMMTSLPGGGDAFQPKPEQPAATYEGFLRTQIGELSRPHSMSYSLAACDSSNANFASAKLDQHPFHFQVDTDQADMEDLVLDPLFELWFAEAVKRYGWDFADSPAPSHTWDWPAMPIVNEVDTANARETNIRTGVSNKPRIVAEDGYDVEEELQKEAEYYGVTVDEIRAKHFASDFASSGGTTAESNGAAADEKSQAVPVNRLPARNGNGRARSTP